MAIVFEGIPERLGIAVTVDWTPCLWPPLQGGHKVAGQFTWWLAALRASVPRKPGGCCLAFSDLALEFIPHRPIGKTRVTGWPTFKGGELASAF